MRYGSVIIVGLSFLVYIQNVIFKLNILRNDGTN